ncbi:MAG TPA: NAD(P)-dependent oxidoreductase [Candidatus Angelobacter sp.]|nr:NAD(P)-dependent oxidoreductase [Candidatus Angelobacter sp.]
MVSVAFVGLGVMGYPMAGHLVRAGHEVTVWNRSPGRAEEWAAAHPGGRAAGTAREAAAAADLVLMCVGDDASVLAVLGDGDDDGILAGTARGSLVVDHTTVAAQTARRAAAACSAAGVAFVDAPVSGGQAGAVGGTLTVMAGGAEPDFDRAEPVLAAYSAKRRLLGPVGAGQLAKMVNQICIAGLVQALAEGVAFAQRTGQDVEAVFDTIGAGAAGSWQMQNRHASMANDSFDFGFAVEHMRKDLANTLAEARSAGAALPVTALVDQFYAEVWEAGGRRWDTSSLITRLPRTRPDVG